MNTVQMRFDEAKAFFANNEFPADKKITVSFDDDNLEFFYEFKKQKALQAISSFRGSGGGNNLAELLKERQEERDKGW